MSGDGVIVLAAARGPLQDGLQAVLSVLPQVTRAERAGDAAAPGRVAASRPALVVLDDALRGDTTLMLLRLIKAISPGTRCPVLTDGVRRLDDAAADGPHAALLGGPPPPNASRRWRACSTPATAASAARLVRVRRLPRSPWSLAATSAGMAAGPGRAPAAPRHACIAAAASIGERG